MKQQFSRDRIPLPKQSSSSQVRLKTTHTASNPISMKIIGKINGRKDSNLHLTQASFSTQDFKESLSSNYASANTTTITNVLKENRDKTKMDSIGSPVRQQSTEDLKQLQAKINQMEDQISKIEYSQDTMRPVLRQIQTPQGQQQLLQNLLKQQQQLLNPLEQERQSKQTEEQHELIRSYSTKIQEQSTKQDELFKRNIDGLKIKKMELDFNLEQQQKYLIARLKESEGKVLEDKQQLFQDLSRKQIDQREEIIQKIQSIKNKSLQENDQQNQQLQAIYERLDNMQKNYGHKVKNIEQKVQLLQMKCHNNQSQSQLCQSQMSEAKIQELVQQQLAYQMQNIFNKLENEFTQKFNIIVEQQTQESINLREQLTQINSKIQVQTLNATIQSNQIDRSSEIIYKRIKNQTKSVVNLSPNLKNQENIQANSNQTNNRQISYQKESSQNLDSTQILNNTQTLTRRNQSIVMNASQIKEDIKKSLESLEAYSLKTSEDINEEIENLNGCVDSNSSALQKSLIDLQELQDQDKNAKEIEDYANRIISQFQQFSEYIRNELIKIRKLVLHRQQSADGEFGKQNIMIEQLQRIVVSESTSSGQSVVQKIDQIKEHQEALKKHMQNTQGYLTREANQIDMKLMQLQDLIVKEIEPYISIIEEQNQRLSDGSSNQKSGKISNIVKQNISAIPEDGAEYLHTEDQLDDSIGNQN